MDDTLATMDDEEELEEEADAEVDKVLFDITDGKLGQAGAVGADLPVRFPCCFEWYCTQAMQAMEDEEEAQELERTRQRLNALLSD